MTLLNLLTDNDDVDFIQLQTELHVHYNWWKQNWGQGQRLFIYLWVIFWCFTQFFEWKLANNPLSMFKSMYMWFCMMIQPLFILTAFELVFRLQIYVLITYQRKSISCFFLSCSDYKKCIPLFIPVSDGITQRLQQPIRYKGYIFYVWHSVV